MRPLKASYAGYQKGYLDLAGYHLWTILAPEGIPGHPYESTVAQSTIEALGYTIVDQKEPRR